MAKKYNVRRRERKDSLARERAPRVPQQAWREIDTKTATPAIPPGYRAGRGVVIAICSLLVLGTVLVFAQTAGHDFVNCDDNEYVYNNTAIQRGLTAKCAWWAITEAHSANWHPLTWMSHALDWQLFGKWDPELGRYADSWPGGHHLVNLALHAICAVLLFLTLQAMTGATWPSALVAALFAIHPLHVESVAWATGRKDTLSAFFFILTLAAYRAYAVRPFTWWRYALMVVCFVLGLASKPMLVTVPFVLLLLDYWPLGRLPARSSHSGSYARIVLEKLPLLALSAGSCYLTTWAQGLVAAFKPLAFEFRLRNAVISYAAFIGQMFWPARMITQYVHRGPGLRVEDTLVPLAVLVPITLAAIWFGLRRRYLFVGWFWYVGMLVPAIGLVQVGAQARADRYTYITQIGLYIMIAWGLGDLARRLRGLVPVFAATGAAVIAALTIVAWMQTTHWRNSLALWEHAVACQPDNDYAQNSYGDALKTAGQIEEANDHYRKSFATNPKYLAPRFSLAGNLYNQGKMAEAVLIQQGKPDEARRASDQKMREALQICDEAAEVESNLEPESRSDANEAQIHFLKAVALYGLREVDQSVVEFLLAIAKDPKNADVHGDLAEVLRSQKKFDAAREECRAALALKWEFPEAHRTLGNICFAQGDTAQAMEEFRIALKLKPNDTDALAGLAETHRARGDELWRQGKFREALDQYKQKLALQPQNLASTLEIAPILLTDPRPEARFGAEALEMAQRVCEATQYKDIVALDLLAAAYAATGDFGKAEAAIRKALATPLGQQPSNAAVLQQRLDFYQAHKISPIPPSKP